MRKMQSISKWVFKKKKKSLFYFCLLFQSKDGLSADCEYILMRLIRGMASAELKTKTGFFSLLVTLLRLHKGITLDHVFQILESKLEIGIHDSSRVSILVFIWPAFFIFLGFWLIHMLRRSYLTHVSIRNANCFN